MQTSSPVLLLVFNRPLLTLQVFEAIRNARPPKLFIAADGPRIGKNDELLCQEARSIAGKVDWPCEVFTLFRDVNLGCGQGVFEAISWFFSNVEQGIVLEDDCLPDESFFKFCDVLLDKYAHQNEVMAISGTNLLPQGWKPQRQSYLFGHGGVWGWASWRRAWDLYDYDMPAWREKGNKIKIKKAMNNTNWFYYYLSMFEGAYKKEITAWDLQWLHCIFNNGGLLINPAVNLVTNIGFGPGATNTGDSNSAYANLSKNSLAFPLKHPLKIKNDKRYLRKTFKFIFEYDKSFSRKIKSWVRLYLNRLK